MSAEKTEGVVIRQVDWSESSRIVTIFTKDFGKVSGVAKGAKRLKSSFESAIDLLAQCRVMFIAKSGSSLNIWTETQLISRYRPSPKSLGALYSGYYIAELLNALTEENDPHHGLYDAVLTALESLTKEADARQAVINFEIALLDEIGLLPSFDHCACGRSISEGRSFVFWVSQGTLLCEQCQQSEHPSKKITPGTLTILGQLTNGASQGLSMTDAQASEIQKMLVSCITFAMDRKPKSLRYLPF